MSLVSLAEVRALVSTDLADDDLQDVIDREEAWLARRIGALTGSRSQSFYPADGGEVLFLRRPTSSVTVTDDGTSITEGDDSGEFRLSHSGTVVRYDGSWIGPVVVTYTPNDSDEVKAAVIELVRLRLSESPYVSERIGAYSYQKFQNPTAAHETRQAILNSVRPIRPQLRNLRLISSVG